ncbi:MAG: hypothetical protein A2Y38_20245 [Spirochaetes bacterium GWB1_59_5]|nr:MAG: hypothetical protein A2Y38_20245 [Spirochaetes bacterium GWB1_59_5]
MNLAQMLITGLRPYKPDKRRFKTVERYKQAIPKGRFTARQIAAKLNINRSSASERLSTMARMGLVAIDNPGAIDREKRFYRWP